MLSCKLPYSCVGPGYSDISNVREQAAGSLAVLGFKDTDRMPFTSQQWPDMCGFLLVPVWTGSAVLAMHGFEFVGRALGS